MALGLADREGKREFGVISFHELRSMHPIFALNWVGWQLGRAPLRMWIPESHSVPYQTLWGKNSLNKGLEMECEEILRHINHSGASSKLGRALIWSSPGEEKHEFIAIPIPKDGACQR